MTQASPIAAKIAKIARTLRMKKRDLTTNYQTAERALMRSFDFDDKEKILAHCATHLRLKQENAIFQEAVTLIDVINLRVAEFLSEQPPEDLETMYSRLCSYQAVLSVFELDDLISNRPPKEKLPAKELAVLGEKDNGGYAKKFAEVKGSTQGMTERLRTLFPPPKTKHRTYAPKAPEPE
jgi:hypothetical protein